MIAPFLAGVLLVLGFIALFTNFFH